MDGRFRFVGAEVARERGSRLHVRVELEIDGRAVAGEAGGIGLETMELRLAAEATIVAIREAIGPEPEFRLVGIKRMHAFDSDVVLVAVGEQEKTARPLIGAVPVRDNLGEAAALAVLSATNRRLGRPEVSVPASADSRKARKAPKARESGDARRTEDADAATPVAGLTGEGNDDRDA